MAINITTADITIDETAGLQTQATPDTGNDVASLPQAISDLLTGLNTLTDDGFPQYAFKDNFVTVSSGATESVTDLSLRHLVGTDYEEFSTTEGVLTSIHLTGSTVPIYLYATDDPNVLVGRLGNADGTENDSGAVAFAVVLEVEKTGNIVTSANAYVVQYASLDHPTGGDSSPDEAIDLNELVYVAAAGTATVSIDDFSDVPSSGVPIFAIIEQPIADEQLIVIAYDNANQQTKLNISAQGMAATNQSIDPDTQTGPKFEQQEGLIIDIVDEANTAYTDGGDLSQLTYGKHVETHGAGFTINQSTPTNTAADILVSAFNVTQGSDPEGQAYVDAALSGSNDDPVTILAQNVIVRDENDVDITASLVSGGKIVQQGASVLIKDVEAEWSIDFTTTDGFDRFKIENADPVNGQGFDIGGFRFQTTIDVAGVEEVGSNINFDDDGPSITADISDLPTLQVDESGLLHGSTPDATLLGDSADLSMIFDADFGADEEGDASVEYSLEFKQAASGLYHTDSGEEIQLSNEDDQTIIGTADGKTIFRISVDDNGEVTLNLYEAIKHPTTDPNEYVSMVSDMIKLVGTVYDGDVAADTAEAKANIGNIFRFYDDGPSVEPVDADEDSLVTDESYTAKGSQTGTGSNIATLNVAALFATAAYGADKEGTTVSDFALKLNLPDVYSTNVFDTKSGEEVYLEEVSGVIWGRVDTNGADPGGVEDVFKISVDSSGVVTMEQFRAVVHDDGTSPDGSEIVNLAFADNLITVEAEVTDNDTDPATAVVDLTEAIGFADDGPDLKASIEYDVKFTAGESVEGNVLNTYGADGPGSLTVVDTTYHSDLTESYDAATGVYTYTNEKGVVIATFAIDDCGNFDFDVVNTGTSQAEDVVFEVQPGPPKETITLDTEFSNAKVTINGLDFQVGKETATAIGNWQLADVGAGTSKRNGLNDDVNANAQGFGIVGDNPSQASQINNNEGFVLTFDEDTKNVSIDIEGIGNNAKSVHVEYILYLDGVKVGEGIQWKQLQSGNNETTMLIDPAGEQMFDQVVYKFTFQNGGAENDLTNPGKNQETVAGVRVSNIAVEQVDTIPNYDFAFDIKVEDKDDQDSDTMTLSFAVSPDTATTDTTDGTDYAVLSEEDCGCMLQQEEYSLV